MAVDYFDYALAIDPVAGVVIPNATAEVYATDDSLFASPLVITDITDSPLSQLQASSTGVFPPFRVVSGETQVFARTPAGVVTPLTSVFGSHGAAAEAAADEAAQSAADAAQSAADAANAAIQALPSGGVAGQSLVKNSGVDYDVIWATVSGGTGGGFTTYGQVQALPGYPSSFPPGTHTHPALQISDATATGRGLMTAVDAQAARAAIGAGTGNGTSNLVIGTTSSTAAAGNHGHTAATVSFAPVGPITANNVQTAIEQAAATGGTGGSAAVLVWRYASGAYPSLPATKPAGIQLVQAFGPTQPTVLPSWIGLDPADALGRYEYMALT